MHPFAYLARSDAKEIFQRLDPRFEPRVYFVSFPPEGDGKGPIRVGPKDTPFRPADFAGVLARVGELEKADPEGRSPWTPDPTGSGPPAHQRLQNARLQRIRSRAFRKAVSEAVCVADGNRGFVAYCGWPAGYDGGEIVTILQLQKDVCDAYYHLTRGFYRARGGLLEHRLDRSLVEAVAYGYLSGTGQALAGEHPGEGLSNIKDLDHLLLKAARSVMRAAAVAGGNELGPGGLFDDCNTLSTMTYEGKEGVGRLVFAREGHPHVREDLSLRTPVPLRSFGAVRKLLHMAAGEYGLLCDSHQVYGLGRVLPTYDPSAEDVFTVRFTRQFAWSLVHDEHPLMHVRYGQASVRTPGFPEAKFRADFPRVFQGAPPAAVDRLSALARCAAEQGHGCMLVISGAAKEEAERLDAQCTRVEPFPLTEALVPLITSVDGSVLVDTEGNCHAFGVILDGMASPKCSPERGSRYNSAVRYVFGRSDTVAVVKSEDGMVNVLPDLKPRVRRSEVRDALRSLGAVVGTLPVPTEALWDLMAWFHDHEFYLTADECAEAERLYEEARQKLPEGETYTWCARPLAPHPEMNESYYLPE